MCNHANTGNATALTALYGNALPPYLRFQRHLTMRQPVSDPLFYRPVSRSIIFHHRLPPVSPLRYPPRSTRSHLSPTSRLAGETTMLSPDKSADTPEPLPVILSPSVRHGETANLSSRFQQWQSSLDTKPPARTTSSLSGSSVAKNIPGTAASRLIRAAANVWDALGVDLEESGELHGVGSLSQPPYHGLVICRPGADKSGQNLAYLSRLADILGKIAEQKSKFKARF